MLKVNSVLRYIEFITYAFYGGYKVYTRLLAYFSDVYVYGSVANNYIHTPNAL